MPTINRVFIDVSILVRQGLRSIYFQVFSSSPFCLFSVWSAPHSDDLQEILKVYNLLPLLPSWCYRVQLWVWIWIVQTRTNSLYGSSNFVLEFIEERSVKCICTYNRSAFFKNLVLSVIVRKLCLVNNWDIYLHVVWPLEKLYEYLNYRTHHLLIILFQFFNYLVNCLSWKLMQMVSFMRNLFTCRIQCNKILLWCFNLKTEFISSSLPELDWERYDT